MHMTREEQKAMLAIIIHATFADGAQDERERDAVRRVAENLAGESGASDLARLYQDVLLKRLPLASAVAMLPDHGQRQFAYEMALCVCEADGRLMEAERRFLDELKRLLALPATETDLIEGEVDLLVDPSSCRRSGCRPPLRPSPTSTSPSSTTRCSPARWSCCHSPGPRWRSSRFRSRWSTASARPMG